MPAGTIKSEDLFITKSSAEMLVVQLEKGLYELALPTLLEGGSGGEILAAHAHTNCQCHEIAVIGVAKNERLTFLPFIS